MSQSVTSNRATSKKRGWACWHSFNTIEEQKVQRHTQWHDGNATHMHAVDTCIYLAQGLIVQDVKSYSTGPCNLTWSLLKRLCRSPKDIAGSDGHLDSLIMVQESLAGDDAWYFSSISAQTLCLQYYHHKAWKLAFNTVYFKQHNCQNLRWWTAVVCAHCASTCVHMCTCCLCNACIMHHVMPHQSTERLPWDLHVCPWDFLWPALQTPSLQK